MFLQSQVAETVALAGKAESEQDQGGEYFELSAPNCVGGGG